MLVGSKQEFIVQIEMSTLHRKYNGLHQDGELGSGRAPCPTACIGCMAGHARENNLWRVSAFFFFFNLGPQKEMSLWLIGLGKFSKALAYLMWCHVMRSLRGGEKANCLEQNNTSRNGASMHGLQIELYSNIIIPTSNQYNLDSQKKMMMWIFLFLLRLTW